MTIQTGKEIGRDTITTEGTTAKNAPRTNRDMGTGRGLQGGGQIDVGHGGESRLAARDAETSVGGWRVAGGYKVKVEDVPCQ